MAFKGYLIETQIAAKNVEALNRSAISASVDFDGGAAVALTPSSNDCWTAATPTTGNLTGCYIAYNASEWFSSINGQIFAGLSADLRNFTNTAKRPFTVFKPQLGDVAAFSKECFDSSLVDGTVVGQYFETKDAQNTWAVVSTPTTGHTAFKIIRVYSLPMPQAGEIGFATQKMILGECVAV